MKTLKLSTLVLLLVSVFFACTKDITKEETSSEPLSGAQKMQSSLKVDAKKPVLVAAQSQTPAYVGDQVTVSYTAYDRTTNTPISCGNVVIYQKINGTWTEVARGNAPTVSVDAFTATTADDCAYQFRAGFDPGAGNDGGGCQGAYAGYAYDDVEQEEFCADIRSACVETFTIKGDVDAVNNGDGTYTFNVTYTLTSPKDIAGVKFQGGATSGGQFAHDMVDWGNVTLVNETLQNTVIKWTGDLKACTPQTVHFSYKRNFSCPATDALVTGDWSASAGGEELGSIAKLVYSCQ